MEPLTLTELGRRMAARWPVLMVLAGIGLSIGVAYHLATATRYEATAVIRVDATNPAHVDMAAEEALASSRQVAAEALDALAAPGRPAGEQTIESIEAARSAQTVARSRVLEVSYVADSAPAAARGADAVAQAYLAVRDVDLARRARAGGLGASSADIIDPARTPSAPMGLGLAPSTVAGLMLGLLVAAPLAARPRPARARAEAPADRQASVG